MNRRIIWLVLSWFLGAVIVLLTLYASVLASCALVMSQTQGGLRLLVRNLLPSELLTIYQDRITFWWHNVHGTTFLFEGLPLLLFPPLFISVSLWRTMRLSEQLRRELLPPVDPFDHVDIPYETRDS